MGEEEEEEYNEIRPQDDCRCCSCGDGWKGNGRGLSKRHNKIIYVVRNAAGRASGVRRGGGMPMRASEGQFMPVERKH